MEITSLVIVVITGRVNLEMRISKIVVKNFRLLKNSTLDLRDNISLLVGKNNTGKTSLLILFEKFLQNPNSFQYNDFPISLREQINNLKEGSEVNDLAIRLVVEIIYDENDNLENLSEFILDLNPEIKLVKLLFECRIDNESLLREIAENQIEGEGNREKFIAKFLARHLKVSFYVFDHTDGSDLDDFLRDKRHELIEKNLKHIRSLINLQIINAKRDVVSSDDNGESQPLSRVTTAFFNSENEIANEDIGRMNELIGRMDEELGKTYESFFQGFLKNAKGFLDLSKLSVISNIQSKVLFDNSSEVIYGSPDSHLPEHLNGLGHLNILYLLLTIEIKKKIFKTENKDINLLFIEEPEAHTHPQMQYIFANNIKTLLEDVNNLQTLITSHSPHIVSQSDFEDIRYLKLVDGENIEIKNFHTELKKKYSKNQEHFKFLKQYLNIQSAELFFASKVIFIEGITERMLLSYFMNRFDIEKQADDYIPLALQNISILEVGANAKIFAPFLEFLDIKTLVITDIDTTKKMVSKSGKMVYRSHKVLGATHTSNETLKYFYGSPDNLDSKDYNEWFKKIVTHALEGDATNIKVMYQKSEGHYHARSFEDAFLSVNLEKIKENVKDLMGLQNKSELNGTKDPYDLIEEILVKKSHFASSVLYLALAKEEINWQTPLYIKDGLAWVQSDDGV